MQIELKQAALRTPGKITDEAIDEPWPGRSSVIDYMQLYVGQIFFYRGNNFKYLFFVFKTALKFVLEQNFFA